MLDSNQRKPTVQLQEDETIVTIVRCFMSQLFFNTIYHILYIYFIHICYAYVGSLMVS